MCARAHTHIRVTCMTQETQQNHFFLQEIYSSQDRRLHLLFNRMLLVTRYTASKWHENVERNYK